MQQIAYSSPLITIKTSPPPSIFPTHKILTQTHLQNPAISAKWGRQRSGSRRSRKLILDSIAFVASSLNILPEPLDSLVREFWVEAAAGGGGDGGKFWFRRGFGGGGGGGGGRRRCKTEKLGFWVALVVFTALVLWVVVDREKQSDSFFWVLLGIYAFAVFCLKGCRREIKDWILGFSCGAALMGLGLGLRTNGSFVRWVDGIRSSNFPNSMSISRKRRNRRWI